MLPNICHFLDSEILFNLYNQIINQIECHSIHDSFYSTINNKKILKKAYLNSNIFSQKIIKCWIIFNFYFFAKNNADFDYVLKNKYPLIQNFEFNDFIFSEKTHIKIDNEILNIINDYNKIFIWKKSYKFCKILTIICYHVNLNSIFSWRWLWLTIGIGLSIFWKKVLLAITIKI